jgi:hypothetical protein
MITRTLRNLHNPSPMPHSDDPTSVDLAADLDALSLNTDEVHGRSSQAVFFKTAVDLKGTPLPGTSTADIPLSSSPSRADSVRLARFDYYTVPTPEIWYRLTTQSLAQATNSPKKT